MTSVSAIFLPLSLPLCVHSIIIIIIIISFSLSECVCVGGKEKEEEDCLMDCVTVKGIKYVQ